MVSTKAVLVSFALLLLVFNGCERQNDLGDITGSSSNSVSAISKASATPGAVYTLSNSTSGNSVIVYTRAADGTLSETGSFGTSGLGTGGGLGDQGALVLSTNNRWLFAVNAGSSEITVFAATPNGLTWLSKVSSGGIRPISLTVHENFLYVLNAGSGGNITGFRIGDNGDLSTLVGSTRPLSDTATGPAQVSFNPNGTVLVVTEKATNRIDTYTVGADGIASGPTPHASAGQTPFGFAFNALGQIVVSEAFGGTAGLSVLSSYAVTDNGDVNVISGNVATHQTAACWVVITNNGKYAYTTNTGSGSISGYEIARNGGLTLLTPDGRTGVIGGDTSPIDMALSINSKYLYTLNSKVHSISAFQVNSDGSLTALATVSGLPMGSVGLVAR